MSKSKAKKAKLEDAESMDMDEQPSTSSAQTPTPVKGELALFKKLVELHWKYVDLTGRHFVLPSREETVKVDQKDRRKSRKLYKSLSSPYERRKKEMDIPKLRRESEKCKGCHSRDSTVKFSSMNVCNSCASNVDNKECRYTGVPQLINQCIPMWSPYFQVHCDCMSCKKITIGKLNATSNSPPPPCTQHKGYAYFQDLSKVNIPLLFKGADAKSGAIIVRGMRFPESRKRFMANYILRFNLDDPLITTPNGLQKILQYEDHGSSSWLKTSTTTFAGLVKVEEENIEWGQGDHWTPTATRKFNMFKLADMLVNPKMDAEEGQGIKTEIGNLGFEIKPEYEYASLVDLEHCLDKGDAKLTWNETGTKPEFHKQKVNMIVNGEEKEVNNIKGCVYLYAVEDENCIWVNVGSTKDNKARRRQDLQSTALSNKMKDDNSLKCVLYYVKENRDPAHDDDLHIYESIFQVLFLLASLQQQPGKKFKGWSFNNFVPPFLANNDQFNNIKWKEIEKVKNDKGEFVRIKNLPDKPIRMLNEVIIGKNYNKSQFDHMLNFATVILKAKMEIEYDWETTKDPLKYSPFK